jgi:PAS domain S-box-containing protein
MDGPGGFIDKNVAMWQLLVESVVEYAIYLMDLDGTIKSWNAGAQRIKGYSAAEIVGSNFSRFYTDEDVRAGEPARSLDIARSVGRFEAQGWRVRKDGTRLWADVVIDVVRSPAGEVVGFAKVTRDVTQRALRPVTKDDDGSAKVLVDNILDYAVFLLDLDGTVKSWPTRRNPKNRTPPRPKCPPTFRRGTRLENAALAVLRSGSTGSEHAAFIEAERVKGRNATALYQDIVEHHAYDGSYDAVKRVARRIRPRMAAIQAGCQVLDREAHVLFEELVLADAIGERASANR